MGDRKQPTPPPGDLGYVGPAQVRPEPPPCPPQKRASVGNGGPAFPHTIRGLDGFIDLDPGMSLRDYFAGQALIAVGGEFLRLKIGGMASGSDHDMAKAVYLLADAMLAAREAGE